MYFQEQIKMFKYLKGKINKKLTFKKWFTAACHKIMSKNKCKRETAATTTTIMTYDRGGGRGYGGWRGGDILDTFIHDQKKVIHISTLHILHLCIHTSCCIVPSQAEEEQTIKMSKCAFKSVQINKKKTYEAWP